MNGSRAAVVTIVLRCALISHLPICFGAVNSIIRLCGAVLIRVRLLKVGEILVPDAIDIVGNIWRVTDVVPHRARKRSVLGIADDPERTGIEGGRVVAE